MGHIIDIGMLILAASLSAFISYRWKYYGFIVGVIIFWALGILRMEALMLVDTEYEPGVLGAAWVLIVGWVLGAIWCLPFTIGKVIALRKQKKHETA